MAWSTEVNVRMQGSNPLIKIINFFVAITEFLTGTRKSGTLKDESNHVVIDTNTRILWFFPYSKETKKIAKKNISAVTVSDERSLIIFKSITVSVLGSGLSTDTSYEVKCPYDEIKEKADLWI